jgi:hypothetical protein
MRTLLAAAAVLVLGGCDYLFSNEPIPVPVPPFHPVFVRTVQQADPEPACWVTIDRDGTIRLRRDAVTYKQLVQRLLVYAERIRDIDHPLQPSLTFLLITADREAPWSATRLPLKAAHDPDVRIYQVLFRVFDERTGRPGWLNAQVSSDGLRAEDDSPTGEVLRRAHTLGEEKAEPVPLCPEEPE